MSSAYSEMSSNSADIRDSSALDCMETSWHEPTRVNGSWVKNKTQVLHGRCFCNCPTHLNSVPAGASSLHFEGRQFQHPGNSCLRPLLGQKQREQLHKPLQRTPHSWSWRRSQRRQAGSCLRSNCVWKIGFPMETKS